MAQVVSRFSPMRGARVILASLSMAAGVILCVPIGLAALLATALATEVHEAEMEEM